MLHLLSLTLLSFAAGEQLAHPVFANLLLNIHHPANPMSIPLRSMEFNENPMSIPLKSVESNENIASAYPEDAFHLNVTTKRSLSKEHSPRSLGHHPVFSTNLDWPVADDGINAEWRPLDGILGVLGEEEASPVKKYATAFKLNYQRMKSSISKSNGIDSQTNAKVCSFDWQCEDSSCAIRRGHVSGRCVPRWYGICHAWAPASILEAEPKCPVVKNGVKFRVQDLKALMSQLYDAGDVNSVFTGGRCEVMKPVMDKYGRYQDAKCRDITPNYFHLAVGNIMGIHDRGFVVDVDATGAVWNQPTYGYNIVSQEEISATMAMSLFQNTKNADKYIFNSEVSKFIKVKTYFKYVVESLDDGPLVSTGKVERMIRTKVYEYILEVDSEDMIVGGEWFGDSLRDHIDFLWVPQSRPTNETMIAEIKYSEVLKLFDQSIKGRC